MRHSKIKKKHRKKRNVVHYLLPHRCNDIEDCAAYYTACMTREEFVRNALQKPKGSPYVRTSSFKEEVTCKKCKKNPHFLIKNFEQRFLNH